MSLNPETIDKPPWALLIEPRSNKNTLFVFRFNDVAIGSLLLNEKDAKKYKHTIENFLDDLATRSGISTN